MGARVTTANEFRSASVEYSIICFMEQIKSCIVLQVKKEKYQRSQFQQFFECICPRVSELMGAFKYAGMLILI